jgi:myo-inositol-1(or 4)-monophosphatase
MSSDDPSTLAEIAAAAAAAGAQVALEWFARRDSLSVEHKAGPDDLVSQADREAEAAILAVLAEHRAADAVLAEESGLRAGSSAITWAIDPIDGTTSYLYGRPDWAVSVAALDADNRVLAGVVIEPVVGHVTRAQLGGGTWAETGQVCLGSHHELARALVEVNTGLPSQQACAGRLLDLLLPQVRDVRRGGSAAAALAHVANGSADAAWLPGLQPWDCAAGLVLVTEAGGLVGDAVGATDGRVPASGDILAAPPELWEPLRQIVTAAYYPSSPCSTRA